MLRKWEWEVPDKVQMIVARAPSDEGLIIFSVVRDCFQGVGEEMATPTMKEREREEVFLSPHTLEPNSI